MTTILGTSNSRGGPVRQTRSNPTRQIKGLGSAVRNNSLVSNNGLPLAASATSTSVNPLTNANEPPGLYPAISHFADAIAALPRDFRRHTSLLKEVDAKAWAPEENLQQILDECLADTTATSEKFLAAAHSFSGSAIADDAVFVSDANSVASVSVNNASLASARSTDPVTLHRRRQFHALRQNLMAIMVTMDEKNHVINNANEDVSRSIRRMEKLWPHISEEISEEARLGSLKHWAYTETNPIKKPPVPTTRREAAASLASLHESETAHRSESRREAMLARKQRAAQHADSDFDESRHAKKGPTNGKKKGTDTPVDAAGVGITGAGTGKRKRQEKSAIGGVIMERSISSAMAAGARAMSRENSQQENAKKRKASGAVTSVARKRINASTQDSPKLASSPLAGSTGKEAYKRSPALSSVRPATNRGRQNSTQTLDTTRGRPSSSTSHRNGNANAVAASIPDVNNAATTTAKGPSDTKTIVKETKKEKSDRVVEDEPKVVKSTNGDHPRQGPLLIDISAAKQESNTSKGEADPVEDNIVKKVASPRVPPALLTSETALRGERTGRGRVSKTSTPIVGTFSEAEAGEPTSASSNQHTGWASKQKRPARPRVKDHGLHDSLSPKGLPMKRSHKSSGSVSTIIAQINTTAQRQKDEPDANKSSTPSETGLGNRGDEDEDNDAADEDEERYCYCQGVSYGEMVACDKPDCPRQWFHLDCIGLKSVPKSAKWYCEECKEALAKKGKMGSNGGNGTAK
ncbi:uncharacterized protein A1O9_05654 [Exophiala aquamarina CBS 119918]|uniref:Chromatin modification-related protein n=1 Tax=Exophiala aquamarina CBS 119918 TaxID=1182545 RepID=A0A072PCC2_9EURO|nr:uncharacterized protein A1O9_05654 [Exophiala aquamarina CBS 119918]KEF57734.1 hypothetical protein A1O9_05654 [Exophiala aquamarina CBS 119918]